LNLFTMYDKRIRIFIIISVAILAVCLVRLVQMQLFRQSFYREQIADLQKNSSRMLKTVRGKILDRKGRILALDEPKFKLFINYQLTSLLDDRLREVNADEEYESKLAELKGIVEKCAQLKGAEAAEIVEDIEKINNIIWNKRSFQAWRVNYPDSEVLNSSSNVAAIKYSEAMADFEKQEANPDKRLELVCEVDISEMHQNYFLLELKTEAALLAAQLEFMDTEGIKILPKAARVYPYGSVAAQTIGWVGPATEQYKFPASSELLKYLPEELCGRERVEYVCEILLRGKRGKVTYNYDKEFVGRTERQFGKDVTLTIDIELQQEIERHLTNSEFNSNWNSPTAAVVIEVATSEILAMVSLPTFDLNRVRYDYTALVEDPNEPLRNRAINRQYPPGSVAKPIVLIAGLESGKITPGKTISCPAKKAPKGWPSCWIFKRFSRGHDEKWDNFARNAIKGSCNIYFSRLADRIDPNILQSWFSRFGYGRKILRPPEGLAGAGSTRNLNQLPGAISSTNPTKDNPDPPLLKRDRRWFGIGQGNFRVTPLQVASTMAVIARGGLYKSPKLYIEDGEPQFDTMALNISQETLEVVREGMAAVVNEEGGTAEKVFRGSFFAEQGVKVYGKTGSTEAPAHAWFAGFAEDKNNGCVAIAVLVEGGQHGSTDAGPLALDIIQLCIDAGYIGYPLIETN